MAHPQWGSTLRQFITNNCRRCGRLVMQIAERDDAAASVLNRVLIGNVGAFANKQWRHNNPTARSLLMTSRNGLTGRGEDHG
jgi:hypothetical protein